MTQFKLHSHRLSTSTVNNVQQFAMTYDNTSGNSLGNIKTKSDIGIYQYDAQKINAVRFITTNSGTPTNPPNVISTNTQLITYTPFLKAATIKENGYQLTYNYGQDYQRIKSSLTQGSTTLETKYYLGSYEKLIKSGATSEIHYVAAGNGLCAIIVVKGGVATPYFVYSDHLGSPLTLTNSTGAVVAEQNFDAWGRYRNPVTWNYSSIPARPEWLYRGFTGHEHLTQFTLINMNGRMYDPVTCKMLSPDNYVPLPWNTQGYNGYSYANNNPLIYTDPDGNFFWLIIGAAALIGGITNGTSYAHHGKSFFGGFWRGAVVGGGAALTGGGIAAALPGIGGAILAGVGSGIINGGFGAALNHGDISQGLISGIAGGIVGGGLSAYFGGGTGALIGGAASGAVGSILNHGNVLTGTLLGGLGSLALYHGMNYYNYSRSSIKDLVNYGSYSKMGGDFQRAMVRHKEFGGFVDTKGKYYRAPSGFRHNLAVNYDKSWLPSTTESDPLFTFHVHWAKAGINVTINSDMDFVSPISVNALQGTTSNGPSDGDYFLSGTSRLGGIVMDRNNLMLYYKNSMGYQSVTNINNGYLSRFNFIWPW